MQPIRREGGLLLEPGSRREPIMTELTKHSVHPFHERWNRLSLGAKFNLLFGVTALVALALGGWALDRAVRPAFEQLEAKAAGDQVERARAMLASEERFALDSTLDYSIWDDSFEYVVKRDPAFELETMTEPALLNAGVNSTAYARFDGDPRLTRYIELETGKLDSRRTAAMIDFIQSPKTRDLMQNKRRVSGFIELDGRILAIALGQVVKSDESGTPEGFVMMAKEVSSKTASAALQATTAVRLGKPGPLLTRQAGDWRISVPITNLEKQVIGSLDLAMPRAITAQGGNTLRTALATAALVLLLVLLAIYRGVRVLVVKRVQRIDESVELVAGQGRMVPLEHDPSEDELGALNHNFNRMVSQLKDLHEQIEVQSFELGRTETHAGILHNVRNSLNPVSVIVGQALSERASISSVDAMRAISELEAGTAPPERRKRLVEFLGAAINALEARENSRREALMSARTALSEAIEILRKSNEAADPKIPLEPVDLVEMVERNAAVCRFTPWGEVQLEVAAPSSGAKVMANRLLLSQVVNNLMTNAVEAVVRAGREPGSLKVCVASGSDADDGTCQLSIVDDGTGFEPERAKQLFERGESSKRGKSGGLGLHWCANTVRAMGGALSLTSEGPGKGAKATLKLVAEPVAA
jgi:signal transduction histidine kinase